MLVFFVPIVSGTKKLAPIYSANSDNSRWLRCSSFHPIVMAVHKHCLLDLRSSRTWNANSSWKCRITISTELHRHSNSIIRCVSPMIVSSAFNSATSNIQHFMLWSRIKTTSTSQQRPWINNIYIISVSMLFFQYNLHSERQRERRRYDDVLESMRQCLN